MTIDLGALAARRGVDLRVWPPRYDPDYLPDADTDSWVPELERADPTERDQIILAKLRGQLRYAWERSSFYRRKWSEAGVSPDSVRTLADLARFPVVRKEELRSAQAETPPFGDYLCVDQADVVRMHGTSGTTGRPTVFGMSRDDWARVGEAHARIMWAAGLRPTDRIMICSPFSVYLGSWGALVGGERLGATMLPFGAGTTGQTEKAVEWAADVRPTAFYSTPSYALHLAEVAHEQGVDPRSFGMHTLFFSGEPGAGIPSTKQRIEDEFGGRCIDMGTMAEMTPWMTNAECVHRTGMHLFQDLVYAEICDHESGEPLLYGEEGTPVYTHLERKSQPMIRLMSGDRARWVDEPCPCGRTYPRLPRGLSGRFDDMFIVRGVNIYPSDVEDALRALPAFGGEFRIVLSQEGVRDQLLIQVEIDSSAATDELESSVARTLRQRIGVTPAVELLAQGTLPRTQFKARRLIDLRAESADGSTPTTTVR